MHEAIAAPAEMSPNAPRIEVHRDSRRPHWRTDHGPGGKNIKAIQAESGADINIEEDGTVHIYASKQEGLDRAMELVTRMFKTIEIGELYTGKIVSTTTFGAFMEVLPGKDGLIHISELAEGRTREDGRRRQRGGRGDRQMHRHRRQGPRENVHPCRSARRQGCRSRSRWHHGITVLHWACNHRGRLFRGTSTGEGGLFFVWGLPLWKLVPFDSR